MIQKLRKLITALISLLPKASTDILIYGIGGSLSQLVAFLTTPVISRILTPGEIGNIAVITAAAGYFLVVMTMNIATGMMRFYYEIEASDHHTRTRLISSSFWFVLVFGAFTTFVLSYFAPQLTRIFFGSAHFARAFIYALVALWLTGLNDLLKNVLRIQRKPVRFLVLNLFFALFNFLLTLLLVVGLKMQIEGFFLAQVIAGIVMAFIGILQIRGYISLTYSGEWFSKMMAYSLPTIPGYLFYWGLTSITALMLTQYTTDTEIGYFSMATKVAKIVELVITAFTLGWLPIFLESINKPEFHAKLNEVFRYYVLLTLSLSAIVVLFAKEIFYVFAPPEYLAGAGLVGLLCLKQAFFGATYTYTVGITQKKKTIWISVANAAGLLVTVALSFLLMPKLGKMGAAIADAIGMLIFAFIEWLASERLVPLRLDFKPAFAALFVYLAVWLYTIFVSIPNGIADLTLRIVIFLIFGYVLYAIIDGRKLMGKLSEFFKKAYSTNDR